MPVGVRQFNEVWLRYLRSLTYRGTQSTSTTCGVLTLVTKPHCDTAVQRSPRFLIHKVSPVLYSLSLSSVKVFTAHCSWTGRTYFHPS